MATTDGNNGVIDLGTTTVTGTMDLTSDGSGNVTIDNANADIVLIASEIGGNLTLTTGNASGIIDSGNVTCLLYTSPSPRDRSLSRMPSSA